MRLSLKAKLTTLISLLVLGVAAAAAALYVSSLTRQTLEEVESRGQYVANATYNQARDALAQARLPAEIDPQDPEAVRIFVQATLATDRGLATAMESAVGYTPAVYYVAVTDIERRVAVHTDPELIRRPHQPAAPFHELVGARLVQQLHVIYGPPRIYEIQLPLDIGDRPLGDIRVGVSTLFLRGQIAQELTGALVLSGLAVLLATLTAAVLSYRLLRPLEAISRSVDRMARGESAPGLPVNRTDEWGILSSKLSLLGEQMRGEKAAFVALKENLDQLFAELTDGLLLFDKQDRLVLSTPVVARFLARPPDPNAHPTAAEVFASGNALEWQILEAFQTRKPLASQLVEFSGDAEVPRIMVSVQFVESEGQSVGSLVTLRDASTRARLEDQIDITAKLAALGRLTSGVAHEVKNPLNAMVLQLELLKAKLTDEKARVQPQLDILSEEIRRLDRVVKAFLDFTRPMEIHSAETDLESLVRDVFTLAEPQARANHVRLRFEVNGALPPLLIDRDLMTQALLNLVLNGCQAMPAGGDLCVRPHVLAHRVELEIADQGVGIPPELRQRIFTLCFTTKPGGSGVGLAMAYRVVQLHNGSIDFTSEVERGTTFRITLPR
jgi:signal transduction histidine kinase/HAMP domain-containing protein